jgi:hypothetical protein
MSEIAKNLASIKQSLPANVQLVAVSKTKPPEIVLEAYNAGQRVFGENKVQELVYKYETLPKDIEWHMIGHLQSNKVKYIASFVNTIHSVDSVKLLQVIDSEAKKNRCVINCLLQVKIAQEESKYGFSFDEVEDLLKSSLLNEFNNIKIVGLMGMATFTDAENQIRKEFRDLVLFLKKLKTGILQNNAYFVEISMGMSDDYLIAIDEGSTIIRVGSSIFGKRIYN